MKKVVCFIFLLFFVFGVVNAKTIEKNNFSIVDNAIILDMLETKDSGYFGVGGAMPTDVNTWSFPSRYAVKLDKNGNVEWEYRDDYLFSMWATAKETVDGNFVVVGAKSDPSTYNIVKFDKDGNVLWEDTGKSYEIENHYIISDYSDLVVDNGGYVAVGSKQTSWYNNNDASTPQMTDYDGFIAKYDFDGNILWKNDLRLDYIDNYNNILLLDNGTYLVTGYYKSEEVLEDLPATDSTCGLFVNYSQSGDVVSRIARCEDGKNISFEKVLNYNNKYYIETQVDDNKYVYVYNSNFEYESSYNLSNNDAVNSFFYIYNDLLVWVNLYGSEIPFNAEISFYDEDFNLLATDELMVAFNNNVFNFLVNSMGKLVISDIIINEEYTNHTEMFDSNISFYDVIYEIKLEQVTNGTYVVEQEGELGKIVVTPDEGYVLDTIKIVDAGGKDKEYYEEDGNYYFELEDGLVINVTYKELPKFTEDVKNPVTSIFIPLAIYIGLSALVVFIISMIKLKI